MKRPILLYMICLTAMLLPGKHVSLFADDYRRTNLDITDSLSKSVSSDLISFLSKRGFDSLDISVGDSPAKYYFKQRILDASRLRATRFFEKTAGSKRISMEIIINKCAVSFHNIPDQPDSLIRRAEVDISGFIRTRNNELLPLPVLTAKYEGRINRDNVSILQIRAFPFLNPKVPEPDLTFFEEFVEPIILVTSAVLTVVLLFSVRSG